MSWKVCWARIYREFSFHFFPFQSIPFRSLVSFICRWVYIFLQRKMLLTMLVQFHYKHVFGFYSLLVPLMYTLSISFQQFSYIGPLLALRCFPANAFVFAEIQFVNMRHDDKRVMLKTTKKWISSSSWKKISFKKAHALQQIAMTSTSPGHTNACTQIHTQTYTCHLHEALAQRPKNRYYSTKYTFSTMRLYFVRFEANIMAIAMLYICT